MENKPWWHNSGFEGTEDIFQSDKCSNRDGNRYSGNFYGPFKTFEEAKIDAISYHTATLNTAKYAIKHVKDWKKPCPKK